MKIKNISVIAIIAFVGLVVIAVDVLLLGQKRKETLNDSCTSVFDTRDSAAGFQTQVNAVLVMNPNETAYIDLSGIAEYKNQKFVLSREIKFKYDKEGEDIYRLTDMGQVKHASDNAPDNLIDSVFFSMNHEKERFMTVKKIKNAYVVGNLHSPVFMCVVK
ncbi:FidL-like protein [Enterobacter hormaechei]|nr:hypothetical protein [Enterobacter hormaechei]